MPGRLSPMSLLRWLMSSHRWVVAVTLVLSALALAEFTDELLEDSDVIGIDRQIAGHVLDLRSDRSTEFARAVTSLADVRSVIVVALLGVLFAFIGRRPADTIAIAGSAAFCGLLVFGMKAVIGRERPLPPFSITDEPTSAYPSGHAAFAVAVWGSMLLVLTVGRSRPVRLGAAAAALLVAGAVGASRVYLGAHWSSDVVAGWAAGGVALTAGLLLAEVARARP